MVNKRFILVLFIILCLCIFTGCKKKGGNDNPPVNPPVVCNIECDNITMKVGEIKIIEPACNLSNVEFEYTLDGKSIKLTDDLIEAKEIGDSFITIKAVGYDTETTICVSVCNPSVEIAGVDKLLVETSTTFELKKIAVSDNATATWRSSNSDVVSVKDGVVTGRGIGTATINVTVRDGNDTYYAHFDIEIIRPVPSTIQIDGEYKFEVGSKYNVNYEIGPAYSLQDVTIVADNDGVVINKDNSITAKKQGKTCLTITSTVNPEVKSTLEVEVFANEAPVFTKKENFVDLLTVNFASTEGLLDDFDVVDNVDGDMKDQITYDPEKLQNYGEHVIIFTVVDKAGNQSQFGRRINVVWNYDITFIGHCGSYFGVPNTEEAFLYGAKNLHYQALECDLQVTKDGIYVTNHDSYITTTDGKKLTIGQYDYEELAAYTISNDISNTQIAIKRLIPDKVLYGHLCKLETYLKICKDYHCKAVIELKGSSTGLTDGNTSKVPELLAYITSQGMHDDVIFLSSQGELLKAIRQQDSEIELQYLQMEHCANQLVLDTCINYNLDLSVNVTYGKDTESQLQTWLPKYKAAGLKISTFTFDCWNDNSKLQKWINYGVDYVTCDYQKITDVTLKPKES